MFGMRVKDDPAERVAAISTRITSEVREVNRGRARRDEQAARHHRVGVTGRGR